MSDIPKEIMDKIEEIAGSAYTPQDREYVINYVIKGYHLRDSVVEIMNRMINKQQDQLQQKDQRIKELEEALDKIANPIKYMRIEAEKQGGKLDGYMAIQLSKDANYLQSIAKEFLYKIISERTESTNE